METIGEDVAPPLANGRYRLVAVMGEGGQGTVFRAWDARLGVWRAVKVLHPGSARSLRERFEAEARTLARLKHPNLLTVHDVGDDGERAFIVMALASESLADRLTREGPLPAAEACAIVEAVAGALSVAHAAGVVHRDIKPENILTDESGAPLLSDFGIARVLDERRTRADVMMGTPLYMPPEQRGGAATADARSDVYGLGATLYTALVGHEPAGPIEELTDAALGAVPDPLRPVLRLATARDPDRRYQSAEAMREALAAVQQHVADPRRSGVVPVPRRTGAGDTGAVRRPSRWLPLAVLALGGGGAVSVVAVALVFAGVVVGLAAWWVDVRSLPERAPVGRVGEVRQLTTYPPGVPLDLFGLTADGAAVLYMDGATGIAWRHPVDGATPRARLHPEIDEPRLVGYLGEDVQAFLDGEGRLALRDVRADRVVPFDHDGHQFELSPRGDRVAWHDGRAGFWAPIDGGSAVPVLTVPEGQIVHGLAWSPDQDELAFVVVAEQHDPEQSVRVIVTDADGMMASRPVYASGAVSYTDQIAPVAWPWPDALLIAEADADRGVDHLVVLPTDGRPPIHLPDLPVLVGHLTARGDAIAILGVRQVQDTWVARIGRRGALTDARILWADEDHDRPVGWLSGGELAYRTDRFKVPTLVGQHPDSPDLRVLAEGGRPELAGSELVNLLDDGVLERAPVPVEGSPWRPTEATRWDPLACANDGSCVSVRNRGDRFDLVHYAPGSVVEGAVVGTLPVTNRQLVLALSADGQRGDRRAGAGRRALGVPGGQVRMARARRRRRQPAGVGLADRRRRVVDRHRCVEAAPGARGGGPRRGRRRRVRDRARGRGLVAGPVARRAGARVRPVAARRDPHVDHPEGQAGAGDHVPAHVLRQAVAVEIAGHVVLGEQAPVDHHLAETIARPTTPWFGSAAGCAEPLVGTAPSGFSPTAALRTAAAGWCAPSVWDRGPSS